MRKVAISRRQRRAARAPLRGHDWALIEANLRKTPSQRLVDHEKARRLVEKLHGALAREPGPKGPTGKDA